ncbi:aminotransferase class IV [Marinobacterium sedimentorum]|uniref:aminotransferase class IV n=1 Tax=Marinobacterium sedimentorum TaxID=2927804 RepID=UPI0020C64528|nr:aminotransferase class IV [Marinobacterium sedimentorum]MCP8686008.1 aminotransferase class IV [Marinobacterium sedimentorum]
MNIVYLKGQFMASEEATVSPFDRGFLFGDSVYEVVPYFRGIGFRLQEHIARLEHSLRAVRIQADIDWAVLMDELVQRNGGGTMSVYLQVTRGDCGSRSHSYDARLKPTVFACCAPVRNFAAVAAADVVGLSAIVTADLRWHRCDIKSTGLLPNILVLQQARDQGADEALLLRDGVLTEGTSCNLFVVRQGVIYTPKRSSDILGGITRELVLGLADANGMQYQEVDIDYDSLMNADEVWISSSTRGVVPVTRVDDIPIGSGNKGPVWARMFELLARYQQQLMTGE